MDDDMVRIKESHYPLEALNNLIVPVTRNLRIAGKRRINCIKSVTGFATTVEGGVMGCGR